ncbi:MAG TPA: pyrimidine dimer DNA glycosylase/endonuclease V [Candidatus Dojkabacteria bacterium]|nr:pyrimidine dimer DNA glycosylase/endonuclease V [Candidatus Dojkabacteria bacterium]
MRLWSISFKYLDRMGLLAVWREALLAKKVLEDKTTGYRNHSQLVRFKNTNNPVKYINAYLEDIYKEAQARGYSFSKEKFSEEIIDKHIPVNSRQVEYEFTHLKNKLKRRDPVKFKELLDITHIKVNNIFKIIEGDIEKWEKTY